MENPCLLDFKAIEKEIKKETKKETEGKVLSGGQDI